MKRLAHLNCFKYKTTHGEFKNGREVFQMFHHVLDCSSDL